MIQRDISPELLFQIEERRPELPGVFVRTDPIRYYPYGETASHIIGYLGKINQYTLERRPEYVNGHLLSWNMITTFSK